MWCYCRILKSYWTETNQMVLENGEKMLHDDIFPRKLSYLVTSSNTSAFRKPSKCKECQKANRKTKTISWLAGWHQEVHELNRCHQVCQTLHSLERSHMNTQHICMPRDLQSERERERERFTWNRSCCSSSTSLKSRPIMPLFHINTSPI